STFVSALFPYAGGEGYISMRAFFEDQPKAFRIHAVSLSGGLKFLAETAAVDAYRAANHPRPIVFCPPITVFSNAEHARKQDVLAGLALSVECDQHPTEAAALLEKVIGSPTAIVRSGGIWVDESGQAQDKRHLHWRLREPARGSALVKLEEAR